MHWGGTIHALSPNIAQGMTINTRIGNKIDLLNCIVRFSIKSTFVTLPDYQVRVICGAFQGNAAPTLAEILSDTGTIYTTKSFYTSGQVGNFKIYHDKCYTVRESGPTRIDGYLNLKVNHVANYASAAAGLPKNQNVFMMFVGNQATGSECPQIMFRSKMKYTE